MRPIQEAITGKEKIGDLSSPYQALIQFYCAFNSGSMQMMSENWAQSDKIAVDNPLGGIKRGWAEIQPVYERIFNGPAEVYVEYFDYTIHESTDMFYAVGRERGYFRLGGEEITLAIRTIRIFQKIDGNWKQVHHHGSIEDPQLLGSYQSAVLGKWSRTPNKSINCQYAPVNAPTLYHPYAAIMHHPSFHSKGKNLPLYV